MMKVLLAAGAQVDLKSGDQDTALILAARYGTPEAIPFLLDNKASIEAKGGSQQTALLAAASNGHVDVVRTLLDRGANVNARQSDESTALHSAGRFDRDLAQLLIERGAYVSSAAT
jgi:ankyrin repeat protein